MNRNAFRRWTTRDIYTHSSSIYIKIWLVPSVMDHSTCISLPIGCILMARLSDLKTRLGRLIFTTFPHHEQPQKLGHPAGSSILDGNANDAVVALS